VIAQAGGLTGVVTAAGMDVPGALGDIPGETWDRIVTIDLLPPPRSSAPRPGAEGVARHRRDDRLHAGRQGGGDATAYCAAKFGVVGFTRALAAELAGQVGVTLVIPGGMRTRFFDDRDERYKPGPDAILNDPANVANAILFALSQPAGCAVRELVIAAETEDVVPVILVLRALGVGDLAAAVPALRAIRASFADRTLALAAPEWLAPLADLVGGVDRVVPTDGLTPRAGRSNRPRWPSTCTAAVRSRTGCCWRRNRRSCGRLPTPTPGIPTVPSGWRRNTRCIAGAGSSATTVSTPTGPICRLRYRPTPVARGSPSSIPAPSRRRGAGRSTATRRSPGPRRRGHRVVVTGSPGSGISRRAWPATPACRDRGAGRPTGVGELAGLVAHARLVISGDTGIAHLATAYGTPSVVLFGPMSPARWGPPRDARTIARSGTASGPSAATRRAGGASPPCSRSTWTRCGRRVPRWNGPAMRLRRSDLRKPGYSRRRAGKGFSYRDVDGSPLRDPEELERIRALVIPPAWQDVWICADPRGHIQATGVDAAGRKQYLYHRVWRSTRDEAKFDHALEVAEKLPELRERLCADLYRPGPEPAAGAGRDRPAAGHGHVPGRQRPVRPARGGPVVRAVHVAPRARADPGRLRGAGVHRQGRGRARQLGGRRRGLPGATGPAPAPRGASRLFAYWDTVRRGGGGRSAPTRSTSTCGTSPASR
jgi:hypothetical protein